MKINKIINTATMMCMGLVTLTSCTDGNDWSVDSAFDRLFGTTGISVNAADTKAEITFDTYKDADKYILELSKDSLFAEEISATSVVDTTASSPFTVTELDGDAYYYLRIKAIGQDKKDSKWVYYKTGSGRGCFHTKAEQLFNEITDADRGEDYIRLSWTPNAKVTKLVVMTADSAVVSSVDLDANAIADGTYTAKNLAPSTGYIFQIFKQDILRGTRTASTTAAMPSADYKYTLPKGTTLTQDVLNDIAEKAKAAAGSDNNYSATIGIQGGDIIDVHGISETDGTPATLNIPDGMSVTFFGQPGEKATMKFQKNIDLAGSHAFVAFNNLKLVDDGAGYFINQSAACTVSEFSMEDVEVSGFGTAFFRLQKSDVKTIDKMTLKNSIFHHMCSGYSFIHVDASGKGVVNNVKMEYCTFYNIATAGKMFVYSKATPMKSLIIDHITMYNSIGANNYLIDFNGAGADVFEISNSLFTKTPDEATKNIRSTVAASVTNTFATSDYFKKIGATVLDKKSTDIFKDAANYNFNIKDAAGMNGVGDTYHWTYPEN